jgi:hypothetical protein
MTVAVNTVELEVRDVGTKGTAVRVEPWEQEISISGAGGLPTYLEWISEKRFKVRLDEPHFFNAPRTIHAWREDSLWVARTNDVNADTPTNEDPEELPYGYTLISFGDLDAVPSTRDITIDPDYRVRT